MLLKKVDHCAHCLRVSREETRTHILMGKWIEKKGSDSLHWFSQRRSPAQRHICGGAHPGLLWPQIRTRPRFLYNAPTIQVSSSHVYSFESYHVEKQTHKQTPLKTSNALCHATTLG